MCTRRIAARMLDEKRMDQEVPTQIEHVLQGAQSYEIPPHGF